MGARFYVNKNWAILAEGGYGYGYGDDVVVGIQSALASVGVSYMLKPAKAVATK
jgi:hypothetical protein